MILNQGINRVRDLHYDDMDTGILGTGDTIAIATQTDLISPVSATEATLTKAKSDKSIATEYKLTSVLGVGNTYREFAIYNASDLAFNRYVFTGIEHTSSDEIIVKSTWSYEAG